MSEKPILFSAPMVRAILDGKKTQTRRILTTDTDHTCDELAAKLRCPYGAPGDRLWVREAWQALHFTEAYSEGYSLGYCDDWEPAEKIPSDDRKGFWTPIYAATDPFAQEHRDDRGFGWRPGIHMPRWASRITLEVTGVRVERLQDITEEDAMAEGIEALDGDLDAAEICRAAKLVGGRCGPEDGLTWFAALWERINGKRAPWASNPWLWVVSFRRVEAP